MFKFTDHNFHFGKDAKAYTEDKVLVYNLHIYNLPCNVTSKSVQKYFRRYGGVTKVALFSEHKTGIVKFSDPMAAAEALRRQEHKVTLVGRPVYVRACDSWDQPTLPTKLTANVATKSQTTTLLCLNDDCLISIGRYLDLSDKIYLAMAHTRFEAMMTAYSRQDYKVFHLEQLNLLTRWQQRELFRICGQYMETIVGIGTCKNRSTVVEFMCNWGTTVNAMYLEWRHIFDTTLNRLLRNMQQITKLCLCSCRLDDENLLALRKLPNLRTLSLSHNYKLTGKFLNQLTTLQYLNLYGCLSLQTVHVRHALKMLTNLVWLNLQHCHRLTTKVFQQFSGELLISVKISFSEVDEYNFAMHMPGLKQLEIAVLTYPRRKTNEFLRPLSVQKLEQLEYLQITARNLIGLPQAQLLGTLTQLKQLKCASNTDLDDMCLREFAKLEHLNELDVSYCISITNEGVLHLLQMCTKLKKLNLEFCQTITKYLVHQAIAVLKETETQRNEFVVISVVETGITSAMEKNACYREALAMKLLKLDFESVPVNLRRIYDLDIDNENPGMGIMRHPNIY